jgi:hypothetical protein
MCHAEERELCVFMMCHAEERELCVFMMCHAEEREPQRVRLEACIVTVRDAASRDACGSSP